MSNKRISDLGLHGYCTVCFFIFKLFINFIAKTHFENEFGQIQEFDGTNRRYEYVTV